MIRNVVSKFLEVTQEAPEDKRGSYTRKVCGILVEHVDLIIFRSLINRGSKHLCMISEDDTSAIALSFAMLMGNDNVVDLLLAQDISPWERFRLLGSPLTIAAKVCSIERVEHILRQPVTMASNPWQPKTIDLAFSAAINAKRLEIALKLMQWQFRNIGRPSNGVCRKWFQAAMLQHEEMFNCILDQGHSGILRTLYQRDYMVDLHLDPQKTLPLMLKSGLLDVNGVYKGTHRLKSSKCLLGHALQNSTYYYITPLRTVLEAGADPNGIRTKSGEYNNPLCDALDRRNLHAVELLLAYGADPQRARTMAREVLRKSRPSLGSSTALGIYQSPSELKACKLIMDAIQKKHSQS